MKYKKKKKPTEANVFLFIYYLCFISADIKFLFFISIF